MIQLNNSESLERLESGIQVPLTKKIPESSTWNLETTAWNPESKTVSYSVEKSLRHVAMDAKFLNLNKLQIWRKKKRKNWYVWLSCAWLHSGRKGSTFLQSIYNVNFRSTAGLSQERLLRSRNLATMVTWRHTSPLYPHTWGDLLFWAAAAAAAAGVLYRLMLVAEAFFQ